MRTGDLALRGERHEVQEFDNPGSLPHFRRHAKKKRTASFPPTVRFSKLWLPLTGESPHPRRGTLREQVGQFALSSAKSLDKPLQILATDGIGMGETDGLDASHQPVEGIAYLVWPGEFLSILGRHRLELRVAVARPLHGLEVVSSQVVIGNLDVAEGHFQVGVTQEAHDRRQAEAVSDQVSCVRVP